MNPRRRRRLATQRKAQKADRFISSTLLKLTMLEGLRPSVVECRDFIQDAVDMKDALVRRGRAAVKTKRWRSR